MNRLTFRTLLFITMSLLAAVPVLLLGVYQATRSRQDARAAADEQHHYVARALANEITAVMQQSTQTVESVARMAEAFHTLDPATLQRITDSHFNGSNGITLIGFCNRDAVALAATPAIRHDGKPVAGTNYSDRAYYRRLMDEGRTLQSGVVLGKSSEVPQVVFASPVRDSKTREILGYSYAGFEFAAIQRLVEDAARNLDDVLVTITDPTGHALVWTSNAPRPPLRSLLGSTLFQGNGGPTQLRRGLDEDGHASRGAAVRLGPEAGGWTIFVHRPDAAVDRQAARAGRRGLLFGALALVFAFLAAGLLAGTLARPLREAASVAEAMGRGDFTETLPVQRGLVPYEMQRFTGAFEAMLRQMQRLLRSLQDARVHMDAAFRTLEGVSERQTASIERQNEALDALASNAGMIERMATNASDRAETVLLSMGEVDLAGRREQDALSESLATLDTLHQQSEHLQGSIQALLVPIEEMDEIAAAVKDLADRSNIVSLNAAIEAAKAKTPGRAFAVVANEMRSLAGQSAVSARHITIVLSGLVQAIRFTVDVGRSSSHETERGLTALRASSERMQHFTAVIDQSAVGTRAVAADVRKQGEAIAQVGGFVSRLRTSMLETEQVVQSSQDAAAALKSATDNMVELVGRFRV